MFNVLNGPRTTVAIRSMILMILGHSYMSDQILIQPRPRNIENRGTLTPLRYISPMPAYSRKRMFDVIKFTGAAHQQVYLRNTTEHYPL